MQCDWLQLAREMAEEDHSLVGLSGLSWILSSFDSPCKPSQLSSAACFSTSLMDWDARLRLLGTTRDAVDMDI
jgi:hypothetical protein